MIRPIVFAMALAVLAACASTPVYGPATGPGRAGFTETQIEENRYFVTYRAPRGADETLLQDYALLRAADITLMRNADWFWVDRRSVDGRDTGASYGPRVGVGVGGGSWGGHGGGGVSVGVNFPIGGASGPRASAATLEIRLGSGPKPDAPNAYDARSVAASLRARFQAPR